MAYFEELTCLFVEQIVIFTILSVAIPTLMENLNLESFKIIKPLGNDFKRKFNSVYLCEHKKEGFTCILKHLKKNHKNLNHQEMLRFEASLVFEHPNLPKTHLIHETEEELLIFKSYSEGVPLNEFWKTVKKSHQTLFLIQFLTKLKPLFDELKLKKLVHSDIKPSNIIIKGTTENFDVFLIDFGLAFYPEEHQRKLVFSLGYSSPELILNLLHLANHSSDLFSLGICIWQLLEGKIPLTHPNPAIMTNLQLTHPLPKGQHISKEWYSILAKMCAKQSFQKPPNMLGKDEIERLIIMGQQQRYLSISEILMDVTKLPIKNESVLKRLIKIFSKS